MVFKRIGSKSYVLVSKPQFVSIQWGMVINSIVGVYISIITRHSGWDDHLPSREFKLWHTLE